MKIFLLVLASFAVVCPAQEMSQVAVICKASGDVKGAERFCSLLKTYAAAMAARPEMKDAGRLEIAVRFLAPKTMPVPKGKHKAVITHGDTVMSLAMSEGGRQIAAHTYHLPYPAKVGQALHTAANQVSEWLSTQPQILQIATQRAP